jgi:hypothetical protein
MSTSHSRDDELSSLELKRITNSWLNRERSQEYFSRIGRKYLIVTLDALLMQKLHSIALIFSPQRWTQNYRQSLEWKFSNPLKLA